VFIYFFYVETKARTLEELDAIFEASSPRKASTKAIRDPDIEEILRQCTQRLAGDTSRI
jgi:hypothetical protein